MQLTTTNRQGFAPATLGEAMEFSQMLSKSAMVPKAYQGKPEDIMVAVQWGYEIGLAPMQALQNISVINGKPSVYGDAAMALVQASPVCEGVDESIEGEGTPNPVAVCIARRKGRNPVIVRFSVEDAKRAGLWGKQGPWQAYPKRMLQMRARGFALRDAFPDVLKGLITAEEAADYPEEAKPREKDVTPAKQANPLDAIAPPAPRPIEMAEIVEGVQVIMENTPTEDLIALGKEFMDAVMGSEPEPEPADVAPVVAEFPPFDEPLQNVPAESAEPAAELDVLGDWPLMVPDSKNLEAPPKLQVTYATQAEWQDAYEDIADKTARAGKRPARERMSIVKKLRDVNQAQLDRINAVDRIRHTAGYSSRIKALGAALAPDEK